MRLTAIFIPFGRYINYQRLFLKRERTLEMATLKEIKIGMKNIVKAINENFNKLNDNTLNVLVKGFWYMNKDTTINISKPIMDCKTGWILQFHPTNDGKTKINSNLYFLHVPKAMIMAEGGNGEASVTAELVSGVGTPTETITKMLYIGKTAITGHANNSLATDTDGKGTKHWVMTAVYEY
jgi:hypothetical protein